MKNLFLILVLAIASISCGDAGSGTSGTVPVPRAGIPDISSKVIQSTNKGAQVHSETGVSAEQLAQVDAGLTKAFEDGKASGWADNGKAYNYSLYQIYIPVIPCQPSPETKTPSFLVRANNYDGSVYDQYNSKGELPADQQNDFDKYVKDGIGVTFAAEMVRSANTPGSLISPPSGQGYIESKYASFLVCPDASVLENGTRYGAEHLIVMHYDSDYFNETMTHSTKGHPILPKQGTTARGLVSAKPRPAKFEKEFIQVVK